MRKYILLISFFSFTLFGNFVPKDGGYKTGDVVKDFQLKDVDNKNRSLKDFSSSKGVILIFTCNTCPFAIAYEDRIVALNSKYAAKGFPVVAINPNDVSKQPGDSFENMQKRAKEKDFIFPYLRDEDQKIAHDFGATKTPHIYILKNTGKYFKVAYIGAIDDNAYKPEEVKVKYAEIALDALLAGKEVKESNTKAIGCTIKWKEKE